MPCDIKRLAKDELNVFIRAIPRKYYKSLGPKEVLPKGFNNIENVPDTLFFNNVKKLLDSDRAFVAELNKVLDKHFQLIQKKTKEFEDRGYDHVSAYAKVIYEEFDEQYRALFLKVFGESEEDIKAILQAAEENGALEAKIKAILETLLPETDDKDDELAKDIKLINDEIAKLGKAQKEAKEERKALRVELKEEFETEISERISAIEQELTELSLSLKKAVADIEKKVSGQEKLLLAAPTKEIKTAKAQLLELAKRVDVLEETFIEMSMGPKTPVRPKTSSFEVLTVQGSEDPSPCDEEVLEDNIFDVAELRIPRKAANLYRSAMLEFIYGEKPIVSAGKTAIHLAEVLSGVLTGGTYHIIKLIEHNFDFGDLLETIGRICSQTDVAVFLVEGVLGKGDLNPLMKRIGDAVPNARIIFSLPEKRFVQFLDPSLFEHCLYFGGEFAEAELQWFYVTKIVPKGLKPNKEYLDIKESLGLGPTFSPYLAETDYSGLVAYCLIPYLIDHEQMALPDILARIDDEDLRRKCKEALIDA